MNEDSTDSVTESRNHTHRNFPVAIVLAAIGLVAGVTHVSMPYRISDWQAQLDAVAVIVGIACSLSAMVIGARVSRDCGHEPHHPQHRIILTVATVMAIFGFLLSLAVSLHSSSEASKHCSLLSLSELDAGLAEYREDTGAFPNKARGLDSLLHDPGQLKWNGPYLKTGRVPRDVWGNEFSYRLIEGIPEVRSAGQDGVLDTSDDLVIGGKSSKHWWSRFLPAW